MEKVKDAHEVKLGDFDPRIVHYRHPKTGQITKINPHKIHMIEGVRYYEWPKGSENLWFENRMPAGRISGWHEKKGPIVDRKAEHKEWHPPVTEDDMLARKLVNTEHENKKLLAELEELKIEKKANMQTAKEKAADKVSVKV